MIDPANLVDTAGRGTRELLLYMTQSERQLLGTMAHFMRRRQASKIFAAALAADLAEREILGTLRPVHLLPRTRNVTRRRMKIHITPSEHSLAADLRGTGQNTLSKVFLCALVRHAERTAVLFEANGRPGPRVIYSDLGAVEVPGWNS